VLECFNAYNVEAYPGFPLACQKEIDELSAHAAKLESSLSAASEAAEKANSRRTLKRRDAAGKQRKQRLPTAAKSDTRSSQRSKLHCTTLRL